MTQQDRSVVRIIFAWTVANFLGVAVVGLLSLFPFLTSIRGKLVSSLLIGLPIGFAQWLALRRIAPISVLWVLTIPIGLVIGLLVVNSPILGGFLGFLDDESVLALTMVTATFGLFVGLAQWLILRGHFEKSLVWVLSSTFGIGLGIGIVLVSNLIDHGLVSIILVTIVYALVTGFAILWMPVSNSKEEGNLVIPA
jgi:hypothetical protein